MRFKSGLALWLFVAALLAHAQWNSPAVGSPPNENSGRKDQSLSIAGVVMNMDGTPVPDCRIELHDRLGAVISQANTGLSGTFQFHGLSTGTYEVTVVSGLESSSEHVHLSVTDARLVVIVNSKGADPQSSSTVSVAELKIPAKARAEWQKGEQALGNHKLLEARKHADRALEIAPQYSQALTLRGILKVADGNTDEGIADLQKAVTNDANNAMGYIALGAALNSQREFKEAEQTLERGTSLAPNAWQGWFELTKAQMGLGEFKDALTSITRAEGVNKDHSMIELMMAYVLLENHQYSRATEKFELFLSREPDSPHATNARAGLSQARANMRSAAR